MIDAGFRHKDATIECEALQNLPTIRGERRIANYRDVTDRRRRKPFSPARSGSATW
jgi:hypothetical protein